MTQLNWQAETPRLPGRVAIVTGAGRGIGQAIAGAFVRSGARVAIVDIDRGLASASAQSLAGPDGEAAFAFTVDISKRDAVANLIAEVIQRFGALNVLVNNAGIVRENPNVLEVTDKEWQETLDVNLTGTFLCSQLAARAMAAAGGGAIVNVASFGAFRPSPGGTAYHASKGGIVALTYALAVNLAPYGIRVNAIAPGVILTAMTPAANSDPEAQEQLLRRIPAGRFGQPEDVAGAAVFLASDSAAYITGQVLAIDGGAMILGHSRARKYGGTN